MAISDIAAVVGTFINVIIAFVSMVTLLFLYRQTKEATKSRELEVTQNIFAEFGSEENRQLRYYVYTQLPAQPPSEYSRDVTNTIERVCNSVDQLGFLVNNRLVEPDKLFQFYGYSIVQCWSKCEPYILYVRTQRTQFYWEDFETIYRQAKAFLEKRGYHTP